MKKAAVAVALLLASLALVACGGGSDNSSSEPSSESGAAAESGSNAGGGPEEGGSSSGSALEFEADPGGELAFTETSASGSAGKVTVDFNNTTAVPHDVAIESSSGEVIGETELVAEGSSSTVVDLKPGKYTYFCSVPGHREAGMEGTLTVK